MEGKETQQGISDALWPLVRTWESPCCPLVWGNGRFEVVALKFPCSWRHCVTSKVKPCCFYFLPPSDDFSKVRVQKLKKKKKKRKNPTKPQVLCWKGCLSGSVLTCCSSRRPGFHFLHPHWGAQLQGIWPHDPCGVYISGHRHTYTCKEKGLCF